MSKDWTDEQLLGYCEIHCKTERALFHSDHINRVVDLAGLGAQNHVREGWFSAHEEMQELVDMARAVKTEPEPQHEQ
jgi:hypothetical protein